MAVDFPNSPFVGDVWQNPVTNVYYEWNGEDWRVKCLDRELECEPTGTWANRGEVTNNSSPTSGVYWRIIDESNANSTDGSNSTKLMPAVAERFPTFADPPDIIFLNDTAFVVAKWDSYQGEHHSIYLYGNQSEFLEDPANADLAYKFCDGDAYVTLDHFNADQKRQDDKIIELEEEFENLLPSLDRGSWKYSEDFTKPPGKFGLRTGGGLPTAFDQVDTIVFNKEDDAGEPHGFADIKVDSYIQLFQDGENDTAIYHVDVAPVSSGNEYIIQVSFVRAEGDYPSLDELFRFKFYELAGGDAGAYVLKIGDTMTGDLTITKDPDDPTEGAAALHLEGRRPNANNSSATISFDNENVNDVSKIGYLTYRTYGNSQTFQFNKNLVGKLNITADNELRSTVLNSAKDSNLSIQRNNQTKILVGSDAVQMQKPIKLIAASYATDNDHVVHKKYVDDKFDFRNYQELS